MEVRIDMKVRQVMSARPSTIAPDDSVGVAVERMRSARARHLPVVRGRSLVGMVSEHEVLASLIEMGDLAGSRRPIRDIMKRPVPVIAPDAEAREAASRMAAMKIDCLPVMEGKRLIGIVTVTDLLSQHVFEG
jgi:acetoin utilization protein AcuB